MENWYSIGATIIGLISFFVIWIYSFFVWGVLFGLAIGWFPAIIGSIMIGLLWPLIVAFIALIALFIYF
ncbi:membrane protein [Candidatus Magnetomorum sp. HK-1]|nr:membrane protein [Candidatus Magnetomorum sp. HK-1]